MRNNEITAFCEGYDKAISDVKKKINKLFGGEE